MQGAALCEFKNHEMGEFPRGIELAIARDNESPQFGVLGYPKDRVQMGFGRTALPYVFLAL